MSRDREGVVWRDDVQSVAFEPEGHGAPCLVHRLAIRTLAGETLSPEGCLAFTRLHEPAFRRAAAHKIERSTIAAGRSLHINSRDVRRAIGDATA